MSQDYIKQIFREQFAKLIATENINVVHTDIETAAFDTVNRQLFLPNWECSDELYQMLTSHEVGHALYTPAPKGKLLKKFEDSAYYRSLVNIFEDVRIEKKINKRYPGLSKYYRIGYQELYDKDVFKVKDKDIGELDLIDRINLHFKLNRYIDTPVPFSDEEKHWLQKADAAETYKEVLELADKFYEEEEHKEVQTAPTEIALEFTDKIPEGAETVDIDDLPISDEDKKKIRQMIREKMKEKSVKTDENLKNAMKSMIDEPTSHYGTHTIEIPEKYNIEEFVVDYKEVHRILDAHYKDTSYRPEAEKEFKVFRQQNNKIVNYLVSQFMMKKTAKLSHKSKVGRTGDLDLNKVHSYRYNEDVFKKKKYIAKGKKHGMIMFLDMSGSMNDTISDCISQIFNLVTFCKKINIPFDVYGFTTGNDCSESFDKNGKMTAYSFQALHLFSSNMKLTELNNAFVNMMLLSKSYKHEIINEPYLFNLGGTPLHESLMISIQLCNQMREKYRLDKMNCIFVTDGGASQSVNVKNEHGRTMSMENFETLYLRFKNKMWKIKSGYSTLTQTLAKVLRVATDCNLVGFFLDENVGYSLGAFRHYHDTNLDEEQRKSLSERGYYIDKDFGYDAFYYVKPSILVVDDLDKKNEEISETKNMLEAQEKLTYCLKSRKSQRVLLASFIDYIC